MNMKRYLTSRFFAKSAIALALFLVQSEVAQATRLKFTWTAAEILAAYDSVAEPGFSSYEVGLVDLFARPDDPAVQNYDLVWFPAPTFGGVKVWSMAAAQVATTQAPALFTGGSPWAHIYDKPNDTSFVYITSYGGSILVDETYTGYRFPGDAKFSVVLDLAPGLAASLLTNQTPVEFQFAVDRSGFTCVDGNFDPIACQPLPQANAQANKRETPIAFRMSTRGFVLTPEPSTALMGGAGLLVVLATVRRRRA